MDARLDTRLRRRGGRSKPSKREERRPGPQAGASLLPRERPLSMPEQDFWSLRRPVRARRTDRTGRARRLAVIGGALALTALFAWKLYEVLSVVRLTPLQGVFLALCSIAFAWIALGAVSAVAGFCALLSGRPAGAIALPDGRITLNERTALLFPIYHEEPASVAATVEGMAEDIESLGAARAFAVFVLSDSRTPEAEQSERAAFAALAQRFSGRLPIYYRRRAVNEAKKAGNIADWVRRFGAGYANFIILDADSVMSAKLVVQLAGAMEANPRVGLIQSVPRLVGATTLAARLQQFATGVYGPVVAAGIAWWHRGQGNYWGHNAIIRTAAFAAAAGLPPLPGRAPLGGHLQSHDFVEAALLVRAGWGVHMVAEAEGSYEGTPPTLIDLALRDRRWAQGNLQHVRILAATGFAPLSRLHLGMGAFAYLSSLLWATLLIVGVVLALQSKHVLPSYFTDKITLFPIWPQMDSAGALTVFLITMAIVMLPKILGVLHALLDPVRRRAAGGGRRVVAGAVLESILSMLLAPILMLTQSRAVIEIILGRDSGWTAQRRDGGPLPLPAVMAFHRAHMLIGAVTALLCAWVSLPVLAWMMPVVAGLILSAALSWTTAQAPPPWLARLLATKEDLAPPRILGLVQRARRRSDLHTVASAPAPVAASRPAPAQDLEPAPALPKAG